MAKIKIQNIGPIVDAEMEIKKVNVIMGPQSSGKSTIAKLISYCQWAEKRYYLDGVFGISPLDDIINFHRFDNNYFNEDSLIVYKSDFIQWKFKGKDLNTIEADNKKAEPYLFKKKKNIYVPSERNFVSAIPNLRKYNETNDNVISFIYDWFSAKRIYLKKNPLPILNFDVKYYYQELLDEDMLILKDGKEIALRTASSGLQSITPLCIVLQSLTKDIYEKKPPISVMEKDNFEKLIIDESVRRTEVEIKALIDNRTYYHGTNFIIEEPEQNLFPETQRDLIYYLLEKLQSEREHSLTISTHSPYILYALNNCMLGGLVFDKISEEDTKLIKCQPALIDPQKVSIYEIRDGKLEKIQQDDGLIGANYFDQNMKEVMDDFYVFLKYYDDEE